jgi:FtsZ-binding cell division protein ZapB
MKEDQLRLLETRINSAISFIENLKSREKKLLSEKEELAKKAQQLEQGLEESDRKNEELLRTQKYLKERIETILGKLEGLAGMYQEHPPSAPERQHGGREAKDTAGEAAPETARKGAVQGDGGIIIEDNIVDLKDTNRAKDGKKQRPEEPGQKKSFGENNSSKQRQDPEVRPARSVKSDGESLFGKNSDSATGDLFNINPFVEI